MDPITLDFIAKQLARVLAEQAGMRDEMLVIGARIGYVETSMEHTESTVETSLKRVEAAILVLTLEVRALRNQTARMNDRVVKLEDAS